MAWDTGPKRMTKARARELLGFIEHGIKAKGPLMYRVSLGEMTSLLTTFLATKRRRKRK